MAAHTQVETEIKLEAPDGAVPDLSGLRGVAEVRTEVIEHEAVYFDTADLALQRARVTLRRRTGGADEGWHLKRPLEGDSRSETHLPLGRATRTVPAALRREVAVHVRRGTLVPVATLRTHRTVHRLLAADGTQLAEVADDVVDGTVGQADGAGGTWREWEVELTGGPPGLLDAAREALVGAGATPAAHASKVGRLLRSALPDGVPGPPTSGLGRKHAGRVVWEHLAEQVAELKDRDPLVRVDAPDAVHKARVATRRLRSALKTFRPLLDREVTDPLRDELKALGQVLGDARDLEVMRARLEASVAELPPDVVVGPVARRLGTDLGARHRDAHAAVVAYLESDRYLGLLDRLDALLADPPYTDAARQGPGVLRRRVRHAYRDLARAVEQLDGAPDAPDAALHAVRKAAKRARYAAEAVVPRFGADAERFAAAVEEVQEVLGEHQDAVVARALLRDLGVRAHLAGENGFTYGLLHEREDARAAAAQDRFAALWPTVSRRRLRRWLKG